MSEDSIKKTISINIAKYRELAGMTQKELAKRLNITPSRVSNWEQGANCPTIDILFEVCEALGVSINDIYGIYPDAKIRLSYDEIDHIKKYRTLDDHGKEMVNFTLEKEYERSMALKESEEQDNNVVEMNHHSELNAAHERTNKTFTYEERLDDENMLD